MAITNYYSTIEIHTRTKTPNGRGGNVLSWTKESEFQGLINQASSREVEAAARIDLTVDYKLYCATSVSLTNDKLLYYNSEYYRIVGAPKNTVERGHHYKTMLKKTELDQG